MAEKKKLAIILLIVFAFVSAVSVYAAVRCTVCNGLGYSVCTNCGGRGVVEQKINQYGDTRYISCVYCKGTGTKTCGSCGGDGWR
jgi:DnaJ-class molecular chaperone